MLRHLGLIAVCACIVASVGCDSGTLGKLTAPDPPSPDPLAMVAVEFGGIVVNAEAGGAVESVQVSLENVGYSGRSPVGWVSPKDTATSGGDGAFTLPLHLPSSWSWAYLKLTGPPGYDDTHQRVELKAAADRPAIRMYPTLVIRPGESIDVRVDGGVFVSCGWDGYACRRVLVAASPGDSVELEVVSHDSSRPMALGLANLSNPYILEPDLSVRRLMVPPGRVPYVIGEYSTGIATLTARP